MRGTLKTAGTAALAALALCATQPAAQAGGGIGVGGAAALGVLGGVVAGSAIASANRPVYGAPPVYVAPGPYGACHFERRAYIDPYGYEHIRRVEGCE